MFIINEKLRIIIKHHLRWEGGKMKKKKRMYTSADIEIINLSSADIIVTSGWGFNGEDDDNSDPGGWT